MSVDCKKSMCNRPDCVSCYPYNQHKVLTETLTRQVDHYKVGDADFIDVCAERFTQEEFRGAMKFYIGKYMDRLGKKDEIRKEVRKIADVAQRWLEYEEKQPVVALDPSRSPIPMAHKNGDALD